MFRTNVRLQSSNFSYFYATSQLIVNFETWGSTIDPGINLTASNPVEKYWSRKSVYLNPITVLRYLLYSSWNKNALFNKYYTVHSPTCSTY